MHRLVLLRLLALAGLLSILVTQEAAASVTTGAPRRGAVVTNGPVTEVYYYRGHYYPYRYHGQYYRHRYYRYGRWHYY